MSTETRERNKQNVLDFYEIPLQELSLLRE
jgi:hypothetical protein